MMKKKKPLFMQLQGVSGENKALKIMKLDNDTFQNRIKSTF